MMLGIGGMVDTQRKECVSAGFTETGVKEFQLSNLFLHFLADIQASIYYMNLLVTNKIYIRLYFDPKDRICNIMSYVSFMVEELLVLPPL
jgi:hypothetical protein